jgi:hypothetical protein
LAFNARYAGINEIHFVYLRFGDGRWGYFIGSPEI